MSTSTETPLTSGTLTARDVLGADPDALRAAVGEALDSEEVDGVLPTGTSGPAREFIIAQAAAALDELLAGMELGQVLMGAWDKLDEVRTAVDESRRGGATSNLSVVSHSVTSEHSPSLELVINQAPRTLLDLAITLGFVIDACDLVIDGGEIVGAEVGSLRAHGEIKAHGRSILTRETGDLDPKRLFTS